MNFLAHALLSPRGDEAALVGNVCADFVKGGRGPGLDAGIAAGIALHRRIDRAADAHEAFVASRALIASPRRRYAPVILDVLFDHCLASTWERHCEEPLDAFVERVCAAIERWRPALPVRDGARLERMVAARWLALYASEAGIERALAGLDRRARFTDGLHRGIDDLRAHRAPLAANFERLFGALREAVGCAPE